MKKVITILFVGLMSFGLMAQDKVAKIEFKTEVIDYGTIEKGSDGVRVFEFTNTGDAPLIISSEDPPVVVRFQKNLRIQLCQEKQERLR